MKTLTLKFLPALTVIAVNITFSNAAMELAVQGLDGSTIFKKDVSSITKMEFSPYQLTLHMSTIAQIPFSHFSRITFERKLVAFVNQEFRNIPHAAPTVLKPAQPEVFNITGRRVQKISVCGVYFTVLPDRNFSRNINLRQGK